MSEMGRWGTWRSCGLHHKLNVAIHVREGIKTVSYIQNLTKSMYGQRDVGIEDLTTPGKEVIFTFCVL